MSRLCNSWVSLGLCYKLALFASRSPSALKAKLAGGLVPNSCWLQICSVHLSKPRPYQGTQCDSIPLWHRDMYILNCCCLGQSHLLASRDSPCPSHSRLSVRTTRTAHNKQSSELGSEGMCLTNRSQNVPISAQEAMEGFGVCRHCLPASKPYRR